MENQPFRWQGFSDTTNSPAGQGKNWVATTKDAKRFVICRPYGPEQPLFERNWKLPDIEVIK